MSRIAKVKSAYSMEDVIHRLGLPTEVRSGELYALCPAHDDHKPSMHVQRKGKWANTCKCWACGASYHSIIDLAIDTLKFADEETPGGFTKTAVSKALDWLDGANHREPMTPPLPPVEIARPALNEDLTDFAVAAYQNRSDAAFRWLVGRGLARVVDKFFLGSTDGRFPSRLLPDSFDEESGEVYKQRAFLNRIVIPYLDASGAKIGYVNARAMKSGQKPKYLKASRPQGGAIPPYLLDMMLGMDTQQIIVTEGEMDCLSVHAALPDAAACAIPGVHTLSEDYLPQFEDRDVIIIFDNDEAGLKARADIERRLTPYAASVTQAYVHPDHGDINDMLVGKGRKFTAGWMEAIRKEAVKSKVYRTR